MLQHNCVLLIIVMIITASNEPSYAVQILEPENRSTVLKHQHVNKPVVDLKKSSNMKLAFEDQQPIKHGQELTEIRQSLKKQQESITLLKEHVAKQSSIIAEQKQTLNKQNQKIQYLQSKILSKDRLEANRATGTETTINKKDESEIQNYRQLENKIAQNTNSTIKEKVKSNRRKKKSREEERPEIPAIPEIGGVLTPRGRLMLEPGLQVSHSSFNQFTFLGAEIVDAFLVGLIQAEDTSRDLISPQLTLRYGITNRLEAEFKIPYTYRKDDVSGTVPQLTGAAGTPTTINRNFDGHGLGDIELALHYQINSGSDGWPFFIGNLRGKTVTGEGPFDVDRNIFGREIESPTGTGFYSLEPSFTILYPTDPAVLFANFGYLINFEKDVNKSFVQTVETGGRVERNQFGSVDPGDSFRVSFGMGYSLNERTSLTLGYKHDFIEATNFEINGVNVSSSDLSVGSLLLGWGLTITPMISANINLELGITQDAPDVLLTLRFPFKAFEWE